MQSLPSAKAELVARKAAYDELKQSRPEEIERAKAQLASKKSASEYATAKLKRAQKRSINGPIPKIKLKKFNHKRSKPIKCISTRSRHSTLPNAVRDELKIFTQAKVAAQEQEVARLEDQLSKHTIRDRSMVTS